MNRDSFNLGHEGHADAGKDEDDEDGAEPAAAGRKVDLGLGAGTLQQRRREKQREIERVFIV